MNIISKYTPNSIEQVIGNKKNIEKIRGWFEKIQKNSVLIIYGEHGIGKNISVELLCRLCGMSVANFEGCEVSKKTIEDIECIRNNFFIKNRIIVINDFDNMSGVSINDIKKIAGVPIVFIGYKLKTKNVSKNSIDLKIEFTKLKKVELVSFVDTIVKNENIKIKKCEINAIVKHNTDLRNIMISLLSNFQVKDLTLDNFSLIKIIFEKKLKGDEIARYIGGDSTFIELLLQENYINYDIRISDISKIADAFSYADCHLSDYYSNESSYFTEMTINNIIPDYNIKNYSCRNPYINTMPSRFRSRNNTLNSFKFKGLGLDEIHYIPYILNTATKKKKFEDAYKVSLSSLSNMYINPKI